MKTRVHHYILAAFAAFTFFTAGLGAKDPDWFYYYHGAKMALTADENALAVQIDSEATSGKMPGEPQRADIATKLSGLGYGSSDVQPLRHNGWVKVSTGKAKGKAQPNQSARDKVAQLANPIAAQKAVRFVSPIFSDGKGTEIVLEPTLLIGFVPGTDSSYQEAILQKVANVIGKQNHGAPNRWFLKTTFRTGADLLDAANQIAALPNVAYAEPNFLISMPAPGHRSVNAASSE
jgi:hypothetical protein